VDASTVQGIIEHPRQFFLLTSESPGSPVFDGKGAILGICVQHMSAGRAVRLVVLPSSQVAEIAKQAAVEAAKPPPEPAPEPASAADDAKADTPASGVALPPAAGAAPAQSP